MDTKDIEKYLASFVKEQKSEVNYGTYKATPRSSLLKNGLQTRANSVWKQSQFVIAFIDDGDKDDISLYLDGWRTLTKQKFDQYLVLENPMGKWSVYNKYGDNKGDISYLKTVPQKSGDFVKVIINASPCLQPNYFSALRTKPFLLLAGISGTGKSRIVREFAFKSCPKYLRDSEGTTPGNYLMVEVKPNWHDSTELLGYWSNLTGKYMFTNFVKFLVKAKMFPDVPFFVCLDEMNLAPVEQYFAEFLSVLETRKHTADGISTGVLVGKEWFRTLAALPNVKDGSGNPVAHLKTDRDIYMKLYGIATEDEIEEEVGSKTTLIDTGLTLPENVFVVGTVNMDDTTHQFSRKVIDRAMTIEMNGGALTDIFRGKEDLTYTDTPLTMADFGAKYITAVEAVEHCPTLVENEDYRKYVMGESEDGGLPGRLAEINRVLAGTPFTVSYRVMNELTIHLAVLLDEAAKDGGGIDKEKFDSLVNTAIDHILLMKILPRIEGDDEMFRLSDKEQREAGVRSTGNHEATKLDWLRMVAPQRAEEPAQDDETEQVEEENVDDTEAAAKEAETENVYMAIDKIDEMTERLNRQNFTRFWP